MSYLKRIIDIIMVICALLGGMSADSENFIIPAVMISVPLIWGLFNLYILEYIKGN